MQAARFDRATRLLGLPRRWLRRGPCYFNFQVYKICLILNIKGRRNESQLKMLEQKVDRSRSSCSSDGSIKAYKVSPFAPVRIRQAVTRHDPLSMSEHIGIF